MPRTKLTTEQRLRRQIDLLKRQAGEAARTIAKLEAELKMVAMLAGEGPMFCNPLHVADAKKIRNRVLCSMGLRPDGTFIEEPK